MKVKKGVVVEIRAEKLPALPAGCVPFLSHNLLSLLAFVFCDRYGTCMDLIEN